MLDDGLFEELPEARKPETGAAAGRPRLREPQRDQIELRAVDLDSLLGSEHPARVIWSYDERLDLSALEATVTSREGPPELGRESCRDGGCQSGEISGVA